MSLYLADENVDFPILESLREQGYRVDSIAEDCPGLKDDEVLRLALERGAILLTEDKDFGELVFRLRKMNAGIVLYRLPGLSTTEKAARIVEAFQSHSDLFPGRFTVIALHQVRIRPNLSIT